MIFFFSTGIITGYGQKIYLAGGVIFSLDTSANLCSYSQTNITNCSGIVETEAFSSALYKDTLYICHLDGTLYMHVLNTSSCIFLDSNVITAAMTVDKSGLLYWADLENNFLIQYNPHTKTRKNLGMMNYYPDGDMVFFNNNLFMSGDAGKLINVNLADPGKSTIFIDTIGLRLFALANISSTCNPNYIIGFGPDTTGNNYAVLIDMIAKSAKPICALPFEAEDAASSQESGEEHSTASVLPTIDTFACSGNSIVLSADSSQNYSYRWDDNSIASSRTVKTSGKYWVTLTNSTCIFSDTFNCRFITGPEIYLPKDTTVCTRNSVTLSPKILLPGLSANKYVWQDGSADSFYRVKQPGLYVLHASNICGEVVDSANVSFKDCNCMFYTPSAFTPNNDNLNDVFAPKFSCNSIDSIKNYRFSVFNRWGQIVFTSTIINKGWNGTVNGKMQQPGVYAWKLTYNDEYLQKNNYRHGTVMIIR